MNVITGIRHSALRLAIASALVASLALSSAALSSAADDRTVYVTKTGTKYHLDSCSALSRSRIPIAVADAVDRGYLPCGICHPPAAPCEGDNGASVAATVTGSPIKAAGADRTPRDLPFTLEGTVVSVTDGDTVVILSDGARFKIRLNGIDCPERDQAYGWKAKEFSLSFAAQKGVSVTVRDIDRYGRYVGDVLVGGVSLNERLVEEGLAWHYREYSDDANLARLEQAAREGSRGLWKDRDPVAPWVFRKGRK